MSRRLSFDNSTKNYLTMAKKFESDLKAVVENLVKERDELQAKVDSQAAKLIELEHENIRLTAVNQEHQSMIGFFQNQAIAAQESKQTSENFAKSAIEIAQKLFDDRESEHGSISTSALATPRSQSLVVANGLAEMVPNVAAEVMVVDHPANIPNDGEAANGVPRNANEDGSNNCPESSALVMDE